MGSIFAKKAQPFDLPINIIIGFFFILIGIFFYLKLNYTNRILLLLQEKSLDNIFKVKNGVVRKFIIAEIIFYSVSILLTILILLAILHRIFKEGFAVFG